MVTRVLLFLSVFAMPTFAQATKVTRIDEDVVTNFPLTVGASKVAPDGSRVVYLQGGVLYSATIYGGRPVRLSRSLTSGGRIREFSISYDSQWVVFKADANIKDQIELFSVPIEGGIMNRLNVQLPAGGGVHQFQILKHTHRVLYLAEQNERGVKELFSVIVDGRSSFRLSNDPEGDYPIGDVTDFVVSENEQRLIYRALRSDGNYLDLYFGSPVGVNSEPLAYDLGFGTVRVSSTGRYLVIKTFVGVFVTSGYSLSLLDTESLESRLLVEDADNFVDVTFTSDDSHLLYGVPVRYGSSQLAQIYRVAMPGGQPVAVHESSQDTRPYWGFQLSPDESSVIYRAGPTRSDLGLVASVFRVALTGDRVERIAPSGGSAHSISNYTVSPDGESVVYRTFNEPDLFRFSNVSGETITLNSPLTDGAAIEDFEISSDGTQVAYLADQVEEFGANLYRVALSGSFPIRMNDPLEAGEEIFEFELLASEATVLYVANHDDPSARDLYRVSLQSAESPAQVNEPLVGDVRHVATEWKISPDQKWIVYRVGGQFFLVSSAGGQRRLLMSVSSVTDYFISADSSSLIYLGVPEGEEKDVVVRVSFDEGENVQLSGDHEEGVSRFFKLVPSPDGNRVLYWVYAASEDVTHLYTVPLGGGPEEELNALTPNSLDVRDGVFTNDSECVVFSAGRLGRELYSIPVGGGTPVRLNPDLNLRNFEIVIDERKVVFEGRGDGGSSGLYLVNVEGDGLVELTPTMDLAEDYLGGYLVDQAAEKRIISWVSRGETSTLDIYVHSVDGDLLFHRTLSVVPYGSIFPSRPVLSGDHLIFRGDILEDGLYEIFSLSLISGELVKLNSLLSERLVGFEYPVSAVSQRVIFSQNSAREDQDGLVSVPIGGGTPMLLHQPLSQFEIRRQGFQLSDDGNYVLFEGKGEGDSVLEVYRSSVASGVTRRLTNTAASSQSITQFRSASEDGSVVYYLNKSGLFRAKLETNHWVGPSGNWWHAENWSNVAVPGDGDEVSVRNETEVSLDGGDEAAEILALEFGGGQEGAGIFTLKNGAQLRVSERLELLDGGVIRGDGRISVRQGISRIWPGASLRTKENEVMYFQVPAVSNAGLIEISGREPQVAEMEFTGEVVNESETGVIIAQASVVRFQNGLLNRGAVVFSDGLNEWHGPLENEGKVIVSGGAAAVFYDDVANSSTVTVSASGALKSRAVFLGDFSGNGVAGTGDVFVEGDIRPGFSPGVMEFGGDLTYGAQACLCVEIGGTEPGTEHDQVRVEGQLNLGGSMEISLTDGFVPQAGMSFNLWDAGTSTGMLSDLQLPSLVEGLYWHTEHLATDGVLAVGVTPERYADFVRHHALTADEGSDSDQDGIPSIIEYLTGSDPRVAGFRSLLEGIELFPDHEKFHFQIAAGAGKDLVLQIQYTPSLEEESWSIVSSRDRLGQWSGPARAETSNLHNGMVMITITRDRNTQIEGGFFRVAARPSDE